MSLLDNRGADFLMGGKGKMFQTIGSDASQGTPTIEIPPIPAFRAPQKLATPTPRQRQANVHPEKEQLPVGTFTVLKNMPLTEADMEEEYPMTNTNREILLQAESGGDYTVENKFGYLGGYQLGSAALQDLGYVKPKPRSVHQRDWLSDPKNWTGKDGIVSKESYLANPEAQDGAFDQYQDTLMRQLKAKGADKYIGKEIDGVVVTEAGLLRSAHLLGAGGTNKALRSGNLGGHQDAFGTSAKDYMLKA